MTLWIAQFWWSYVLPAALQATPLLLAAAALDLLMPRFAAPRWRAWLWTLVAWKLIVPVSLWGWLPAAAKADAAAPAALAWGLPWLWLGGLAILAAGGQWWMRRIASHWRRTSAPTPSDLRDTVDRWSAALSIPAPPILVTPALATPLIHGGTLYWPKGLETELSPGETDQAIRHELVHLKRRDGWRGLFWIALVAVFWFHPLVWWAARRMRALREECCDRSAAALPGHAAAPYEAALLRVLERVLREAPPPGWAWSLVDPRTPLTHRLAMLAPPRQTRSRRWTAAGCVLLVALAWPACGWAHQRAADTAEWITRPPGSLQLRFLVLERLAGTSQ